MFAFVAFDLVFRY